MIEVIDVFVRELTPLIDKITTAWEKENLNALESYVHELKGASGSAGFFTLADNAADVEQLVQSSQINLLAEALDHLKQTSEEILVTYSG